VNCGAGGGRDDRLQVADRRLVDRRRRRSTPVHEHRHAEVAHVRVAGGGGDAAVGDDAADDEVPDAGAPQHELQPLM
jgi:hypothetical protein